MEGSFVAADQGGERILAQTGWHERTLEEELTKKQDEFAGLLTRDDAMELIAREKGVAPIKREERAATALAEVKPGELEVCARARVWHVFATKHFSKKTPFGERAGKVRNMLVKDATGEATVVLWGKDAEWPDTVGLHRNSIMELFGAASKLGTRGMELHSSLTTRLALSPKEEGLPTCPAKMLSPAELSEGQTDVDVKGVISKVGRKSEFTRVKKTGETEKGQVFDCWLQTQGKQVRLVAWDSNALYLAGAQEGDCVTLEGGSVKNGRDGAGLEVHAGWAAHLLLEKVPGNTVSNTSGQAITLANASASIAANDLVVAIGTISSSAQGASVLVQGSVKSVSNAWSLLKCASCGAKMPLKAGAEANCSCGGKFSKLFVVRALLEDATGEVETAFFNEQALALLGLNSIPLDSSAIIDLKKDEATGKKFRFQLKLKKSQFSNQMEATAYSLAPASDSVAN